MLLETKLRNGQRYESYMERNQNTLTHYTTLQWNNCMPQDTPRSVAQCIN